jgi:predicted Fe-Mo cluster-binding NifX family protein
VVTRLGVPLSLDRLDAPLSEHFGKAPWLAVLEAGAPPRFLRNEGQCGSWVAGALAAAGVTDVAAGHLGAGAYRHLAGAGLKVWAASPPGATATELLASLAAGMLAPLAAPAPGPHGHGGCGCGH